MAYKQHDPFFKDPAQKLPNYWLKINLFKSYSFQRVFFPGGNNPVYQNYHHNIYLSLITSRQVADVNIQMIFKYQPIAFFSSK